MGTFAYDFDSQVLSGVACINPVPLTYSLSGPVATQTPTPATTNTVVLSTCGTNNGKSVYGLAFNALSTKNSVFVTLSAATGTTFKVDTKHNGSTFALLYTDGSFSYFTVATGSTRQTLTTPTGQAAFDVAFPEQRRLRLLEVG